MVMTDLELMIEMADQLEYAARQIIPAACSEFCLGGCDCFERIAKIRKLVNRVRKMNGQAPTMPVYKPYNQWA